MPEQLPKAEKLGAHTWLWLEAHETEIEIWRGEENYRLTLPDPRPTPLKE